MRAHPLSSMDPDGKNQLLTAQGLRNAVDMRYVAAVDGGALFATNMGDDHLGDHRPDDTFLQLEMGQPPINYGWPVLLRQWQSSSRLHAAAFSGCCVEGQSVRRGLQEGAKSLCMESRWAWLKRVRIFRRAAGMHRELIQTRRSENLWRRWRVASMFPLRIRHLPRTVLRWDSHTFQEAILSFTTAFS